MTRAEYRVIVYAFLDDLVKEKGTTIIKFDKICPTINLTYHRGQEKHYCPILPNEEALPYFKQMVKEYNEEKGKILVGVNDRQVFTI